MILNSKPAPTPLHLQSQERAYWRILAKPVGERTVDESRLVMYHEMGRLCPPLSSVWPSEDEAAENKRRFQESGAKGGRIARAAQLGKGAS